MLLLALAQPSLAATLTVGASGRDFTAIQAAIDASASGDTIAVDAGSWAESLTIDHDLTLSGAGPTTILATSGTAITVSSGTVAITDLAITPVDGRGIVVQGGTVAVADVAITGTVATDGGPALSVGVAAVDLTRVTFDRNDAGIGNGGSIVTIGGTVTVTDCAFTGGRAEKGGAIWAYQATLEVAGSTFDGNQALADDEASRGGAIRAQDSDVTISGSTFTGNVAEDGYGGHIATFGGTLTIATSTFTDGEANGLYGGAIATADTETAITDSEFTGNTATLDANSQYGNGGAIIVSGTGITNTAITGCTFDGNVAQAFGGALRVEAGDVTIVRSTFTDNAAVYGGAAHIATIADAVLQDSTLSGNRADYGGAIRWRPDAVSGTLALIHTTFADNLATAYGGAVYGRTGGQLTVEGSAFARNTAVVGGALMLWDIGDVEVHSAKFCANAASGASDADGGAATVYVSGSLGHSWTNSVFVDNVADGTGGGLNLLQSGPADVINDTFLGNDAAIAGGAIAVRGGELTATNDLFAWTGSGDALTADTDSVATVLYDDFYDDRDDPVGGALEPAALDASNLALEPALADWTDDGDCDNDVLTLAVASPLIDAGDPSLLDPDGSRSDIGAFGGPGADVTQFTDTDGDGFVDAVDCDPADADVFPGADEVAYDGIDQDCDGADLDDVDGDGFAGGDGGDDCDDDDATTNPAGVEVWYDGIDQDCDGNDGDQDGDGSDATAVNGDDCNDADPAVHPGAEDADGDGVDANCDGSDGTVDGGDDTDGGGGGKGCGCASGGGSGTAWLLGVLVAVRWSRRRDPRV
jgi:MYXO-CTERM domain-containing protein